MYIPSSLLAYNTKFLNLVPERVLLVIENRMTDDQYNQMTDD
jgi:hypothetical protein